MRISIKSIPGSREKSGDTMSPYGNFNIAAGLCAYGNCQDRSRSLSGSHSGSRCGSHSGSQQTSNTGSDKSDKDRNSIHSIQSFQSEFKLPLHRVESFQSEFQLPLQRVVIRERSEVDIFHKGDSAAGAKTEGMNL
jgi:hypothetical protein